MGRAALGAESHSVTARPVSAAAPRLVQASPIDQARRWAAHFHAWGTGYDQPLFIRREAALAESAYGHAHLKMWLWVDADGNVLSSCETYASQAWYCDDKGRLSIEPIQSIASVLTVPELRNQGHAAAMMTALVGELRALGTTASTLYSDVGPNIYRRAGYMLHPARESVVPVDPDAVHPNGCEELGIGDVADLLQRDNDQQSAWLGGSAAPGIAEILTADRVAWFQTRARYRAWARGQSPNPVVGAACGNDGFCLWSADSAEPVLYLLAWRPRDAAGAEKLTQAACAHARELGLTHVIAWDADRDTGLDPYRRPLLQPRHGLACERDSSLPMLAWMTKGRPMPLVWQGIERHGWC